MRQQTTCIKCGGPLVIRGADDEFGDNTWVECAECGEVADE